MSANFSFARASRKGLLPASLPKAATPAHAAAGKRLSSAVRPFYRKGMNADPVLLCLCTCPDAATATRLAEMLVGEQLAACVNRLPGVHSTYRWQGEVHTDAEELLLIKTTAGRFEALKARLLALHPYELPELIALPVERGHAAYLDWVRANVAE